MNDSDKNLGASAAEKQDIKSAKDNYMTLISKRNAA